MQFELLAGRAFAPAPQALPFYRIRAPSGGRAGGPRRRPIFRIPMARSGARCGTLTLPPRRQILDDDAASATANGAAAMRAAGTYDPVSSRRNPDHLALALTSPAFRFLISCGLTRGLLLRYADAQLPGIFAAHQARTLHVDEGVRGALKRGAEQVVVLGAGMDSRAYRLRDLLGDVKVFEVDHPATGALKRERLQAAGVAHDHVCFVPVDFLDLSWPDALLAAGVDTSLRTLFIWEGVTPYLDAAAVDAVCAFVTRFAPGSVLLTDYFDQRFIDHPEQFEGGRKHASYVADRDEAYRFGLNPDDVASWAAARGFSVLRHVSGEELEARYRLTDAGRAPVPAFCALIDLEVVSSPTP